MALLSNQQKTVNAELKSSKSEDPALFFFLFFFMFEKTFCTLSLFLRSVAILDSFIKAIGKKKIVKE